MSTIDRSPPRHVTGSTPTRCNHLARSSGRTAWAAGVGCAGWRRTAEARRRTRCPYSRRPRSARPRRGCLTEPSPCCWGRRVRSPSCCRTSRTPGRSGPPPRARTGVRVRPGRPRQVRGHRPTSTTSCPYEVRQPVGYGRSTCSITWERPHHPARVGVPAAAQLRTPHRLSPPRLQRPSSFHRRRALDPHAPGRAHRPGPGPRTPLRRPAQPRPRPPADPAAPRPAHRDRTRRCRPLPSRQPRHGHRRRLLRPHPPHRHDRRGGHRRRTGPRHDGGRPHGPGPHGGPLPRHGRSRSRPGPRPYRP